MADLVLTSEDIKEAIFESLKYFPDVPNLKPEQRLIVEHVVHWKDVFAALPTGFGKSLTFQILPAVFKVLLDKGFIMLVIVVSPLTSIVKDQVGYLRNLGFEVAFIGESEKLDKDIIQGNIKAQFLYGSPESIVGDIKFKEMFSQLHYRRNVVAIVCDEVHTVVHW